MSLRPTTRDFFWCLLFFVFALAWWTDHYKLEAKARFTVETVSGPQHDPTVLRDNVTDEILVKKGETWLVGRWRPDIDKRNADREKEILDAR